MPDASQIAAAINLRVRQLETQGITGIALANHMIGHMQDLHRIYMVSASDRTLRDLCRRFPGFERYARLMEGVSEQNQAMAAAGTHPYGDLPELPEPLKASLLHLMRAAAELEREFQATVDGGRDRASGSHETLAAPQTYPLRAKYHVSSLGRKPSGRSCGRRIQVSSGSRPAGLARLSA